MKRIFKWLETKFSRHSATVEADERHTPVEKHHTPVEKHDSHDTITQPVLRIREESSYVVIESPGLNESPGFDPYNSGSFETSKSRSRK